MPEQLHPAPPDPQPAISRYAMAVIVAVLAATLATLGLMAFFALWIVCMAIVWCWVPA